MPKLMIGRREVGNINDNGMLHVYNYENRYHVACPILQDAAVQEIVCIELDTCDQ